MLPSRLKCDSCTCPTKHTHKDAALLQFISVCLPPAPLLSSALPLSLDSAASVLSQASRPRGPGEWKGRWVKGGEAERQFESKRKRRGECKRRTAASFAVLVLLFSSEQNSSSEREGGEGARPIFITSALFMLLTHVWYQCMTTGPWQTAVSGKRASSTTQPPKSTPTSQFCTHNHLCFFSLHPNVFWPSQLVFFFFCCMSVWIIPHLLLCFPLYCFSFLSTVSLSHYPHLSPHPTLMSRWWLSRIETGHLRSLQWHWEAKLPWMCVCVTHCHHPQYNRGHTEFMFPAARAILTPGTFLS